MKEKHEYITDTAVGLESGFNDKVITIVYVDKLKSSGG